MSSLVVGDELYPVWYKSVRVFYSDVLATNYSDFLLDQVSYSLWEVMTKENLGEFLQEFISEEIAYIGDEWHIETPMLLLREMNSSSNVKVYLAGNESEVDVDFFCSVLKLSFLFYRAHIDKSFDVWGCFSKLDGYVLKTVHNQTNSRN